MLLDICKSYNYIYNSAENKRLVMISVLNYATFIQDITAPA